jgi:hypothetical protein
MNESVCREAYPNDGIHDRRPKRLDHFAVLVNRSAITRLQCRHVVHQFALSAKHVCVNGQVGFGDRFLSYMELDHLDHSKEKLLHVLSRFGKQLRRHVNEHRKIDKKLGRFWAFQ